MRQQGHSDVGWVTPPQSPYLLGRLDGAADDQIAPIPRPVAVDRPEVRRVRRTGAPLAAVAADVVGARMDAVTVSTETVIEPDRGPGPSPEPSVGRLTRWFGPLTALRVVAMLVAVAFLGGAVGWTLSERSQDPFSATDVGFMRDMSYHHEQAIEMSLILLGKPDVDADLKSFAQEFIIDQRYEQGIFNALLDRYGYSSTVGKTVMGWMGPPLARDDMEGLASDQQITDLRDASGRTAESLFVALMTEHHLGGLHMADWAARKGQDKTVRNLALAMVKTQRGEVVDLNSYRIRNDLPFPKGFSDPMADQRLKPLSLDQG